MVGWSDNSQACFGLSSRFNCSKFIIVMSHRFSAVISASEACQLHTMGLELA